MMQNTVRHFTQNWIFDYSLKDVPARGTDDQPWNRSWKSTMKIENTESIFNPVVK